ncbi:helix-turn-helix domain-containing protein [Blastococcus montanus]|uniref:helix-turn-helix domain-containing protein n=1 Tax=Blastococcus montanus TaxID=3144973 RepID=UPI00320AB5BF
MNRTRAELVGAAARAFAAQGLRRSTMASIAAEAGVAKGTLYNYFRTKDDVAWALLVAETERLIGLAGDRPRADALAALADELATHPVLRRLAEDEPGRLTLDPDRWAGATGRLADVLDLDEDGAELTARWLLGLVLQPGRTTARRRQAELLAAALAPGARPVSAAAGPA